MRGFTEARRGLRPPAGLVAHINWDGRPGPFTDLPELAAGDRVRSTRADGSTVVFRVTRVERYSKDEFPTRQVYSDIPFSGLRLITCGGDF